MSIQVFNLWDLVNLFVGRRAFVRSKSNISRKQEKKKIIKKMDANKAISKERMKWRCEKHPKYPCDIICLDGDIKERVMCLMCL